MNLITAIETVTLDVQASYPELSRPLAILHALNTTSITSLNTDDATAPAYVLLHAAPVAELVLGIAKLDGHRLDRGEVHEDSFNGVTIDGMDPFEWLDAVYYA